MYLTFQQGQIDNKIISISEKAHGRIFFKKIVYQLTIAIEQNTLKLGGSKQ